MPETIGPVHIRGRRVRAPRLAAAAHGESEAADRWGAAQDRASGRRDERQEILVRFSDGREADRTWMVVPTTPPGHWTASLP